MPGFIRISRDLFDDPAFTSVRFPRPWALIDLVQMARYKSGQEFVNGRVVSLERGQLSMSIRSLAARWKWDEKTVQSFLRELVNGGVITYELPHQKAGLTNIISIVNYDTFDGDSHTDSHTTSHSDSHTDSHTLYIEKKEIKENKEVRTNKKETSVTIVPEVKKAGPDAYQVILNLWNAYAKRNVPKIKAITQPRRDKIKLRIAEMGGWEQARETLETCFKKISESDFATGATGRWVATFDWFFENEKNWLKVLEGNYDNRKEKSQLEVLAENVAKADAYYGQRYGYRGASPYGDQTGSGPYGPDEQ